MKKLSYYLLPLVLFLSLCLFLYQGLFSDPRERDSTVLERPFPVFTLPDLMDESVSYDNSVFDNDLTLVNVWGVWCVTCAIELPYLEHLKNQGFRIVGLYYDQDLDPNYGTKTLTRVRQEVKQTLAKYGDPYAFNIFDVYRDTALDLGVTGAPETFLVDAQGVIRVHHLGDINDRVWQGKFMPVISDIRQSEATQVDSTPPDTIKLGAIKRDSTKLKAGQAGGVSE